MEPLPDMNPLQQAMRLRDFRALQQAVHDKELLEVLDAEGYTLLTWALYQRFVGAVRLLLVAGADPNHMDSRNNVPLLQAVRENSPLAVELLLQYGADPNRYTAIVGSCRSVTILDTLARFGADMNLEDQIGCTPVFQQIYQPNNHEIIPRMVAYGANLNHKNHYGRTPLEEAVDEHDREGAAALLDCGADPTIVLSEWSPVFQDVLIDSGRIDLYRRFFGQDP